MTQDESDVSDLVELGLTRLQSKVYLALLRSGPSPASKISSMLGTVRPETYRVIRELMQKGLIERSPGSPSSFTAIRPDRAIRLLYLSVENRLVELRAKRDVVIRSLKASVPPVKNDDNVIERFGLIAGVGNTLKRHVLMINQAKNDYVSIASKYSLRRLGGRGAFGAEFFDAIKRARRRGVRIRVISAIDESNLEQAGLASDYAGIHILQDVLLPFDIFDHHELIIGPPVRDEEASSRYVREDYLWTNNSRFISGMYALFERLWMQSPPYNHGKQSPLLPDPLPRPPQDIYGSPSS